MSSTVCSYCQSENVTRLATKVYRALSPHLLALISVPVYLLKYRKYRLVKQVEVGFADHTEQQLCTPDAVITRLIAAYNRAKTDQKLASGPYQVGHLWREILDTRFGKLIAALQEHDSAAVRAVLENFNREDCGDDTCGGGQYYQRMSRVPFYKYQYINAWQRRYNACKRELNKEPVFTSKLIGNPVGVFRGNHVVPLCNIEYYYYAAQIQSLLRHTPTPPVICEIGGGVGGQAYETLTNLPSVKYIVLDIPEVLVLSAYYLMMAFPEKRVLLYGEDDLSKIYSDEYDTILMPNFVLPELRDASVDLFFNSCSFSEMDYSTTQEYLCQIERICCRYLMHVNHNARLVWYENNHRITNMIADEAIPASTLFRRVYRKRRLFSLLEDTFVIHWFYRARYYHYLYVRE